LNYTNITEELFESYFVLRSSTGITYDFKLNSKFRLGTEILYSGRGYGLPFFEANTNVKPQGVSYYRIIQNYISLPIKFGINLNESQDVIFNIGIAPSININSSVKKEINDPTLNVIEPLPIDLAALMELQGVMFKREKSEIYSSLGFRYGITPVQALEGTPKNIGHYLAQVSLGYRFAI